jgi:hypothetical protein
MDIRKDSYFSMMCNSNNENPYSIVIRDSKGIFMKETFQWFTERENELITGRDLSRKHNIPFDEHVYDIT